MEDKLIRDQDRLLSESIGLKPRLRFEYAVFRQKYAQLAKVNLVQPLLSKGRAFLGSNPRLGTKMWWEHIVEASKTSTEAASQISQASLR
mgnify:FL=1